MKNYEAYREYVEEFFIRFGQNMEIGVGTTFGNRPVIVLLKIEKEGVG